MNGYRSRLLLLIVAGLFSLCGANCVPWVRQRQTALPPVLPLNPTLEQVIEAVNRNNGQIQSLTANNAYLSTPGNPTLRANVVLQRPMGIRLHGTYGLTGPELDIGSNDSLFWFWVRRSDPPAVYYCRHDQFAASPARQMVPIQPDWLIDSLGVGTLDPSLSYQDPIPMQNGRLEIRSVKETPEGQVTKRTFINASQAWIVGQEIYGPQNNLLLSTQMLDHRQDPRSSLWMPRTVKINCPTANFSMQLDLGNAEINVPPANPTETFTMPTIPNSPAVDIGDPNYRPPQR